MAKHPSNAAKRNPRPDTESSDALKVEQWPVSRLAEYPYNPRDNDSVVDRMCQAITAFGFRIPIVARSDGLIIDGHLRLKAAKRLGLETVPVALADDLSEDEVKAFRILANQSANWAKWNDEFLKRELLELKAHNFNLELTGFDPTQVVGFMTAGDSDAEEDTAPEPPTVPVSKDGDLWLLGGHRLLCGDATNKNDVARLLGQSRPRLMVTDPPYGVDYDPNWRNEAMRSDGSPSDGRAIGKPRNDDRSDWREAWALFPGDVAYCWHDGLRANSTQHALESSGFKIRAQIIWAKQHFVIGRGDYHVQHEPCLYAVREGKTGGWQGGRAQSTIWQIDKPVKSETGHSTQKPIECMKRPIENNTKAGDSVYDPFVGSGTTIIAAEKMSRHCCAIEIEPTYVDVSVCRWQEYTKREATLDGDGRTFKEVAAARSVEPNESWDEMWAKPLAKEIIEQVKQQNGPAGQKPAEPIVTAEPSEF